MKLKVCENNMLYNKKEISYKEYGKHDKIIEFLEPEGMTVTFEKYYIDDSCLMLNGTFPYMIIEGKLKWNVPYDQVTVDDFLNTHPTCVKDGIEYETGMPAAGGPGGAFGKFAVGIFKMAIEQNNSPVSIVIGISVLLQECVGELEDYYEEQKISPIQHMEAILNSGCTGVIAIEELFNYDEYHARKLLTTLGFKFDEDSGKYVIGNKERVLAKKFIKDISIEELKYF